MDTANTIQFGEYSTGSGRGDIPHRIWAVNANWNASNREWNVYANSVTNPNEWNAGNQVVSRNSICSKASLWGFCLLLPSAEHLKLELHPDKVYIKTLASGIDFLGWVHFPDHRVLRTATRKRMMRKMMAEPPDQARSSYLGMLSHGNTKKLQTQIEKK